MQCNYFHTFTIFITVAGAEGNYLNALMFFILLFYFMYFYCGVMKRFKVVL